MPDFCVFFLNNMIYKSPIFFLEIASTILKNDLKNLNAFILIFPLKTLHLRYKLSERNHPETYDKIIL